MSGDDRGHDSDAYRALWSEIAKLKQGEKELKQELADVKQQQTMANRPVEGPRSIKIESAAEDVAVSVSEAMQDEDEEVALEESTWVFPLLLGDLLGLATSTYLVFLLLVTATIQVAFLYLLAIPDSGMISPQTTDDVYELRNWRRTVAHDFKYYNELEEASLASRVCGAATGKAKGASASSALELAGSQAQLYEDLSGDPPPLPFDARTPPPWTPHASPTLGTLKSPPHASHALARPQATWARTVTAWARVAR